MRLGDFELHIISDGRARADGGGFFGLVPKVLWEREMPADSFNRIPVALNLLLIKAPGANILVDTGYGHKFTQRQLEMFGVEPGDRLLEELAKLGLRPEDIDIVVNTHLHADHAAGNTVRHNGRIVPTFPRAEYWVQRREWHDANNPNERTRATYIPENLLPLEEHRVLHLLDGDEEVVPGVRCEVTPGHVPSHQSVVVEAGGQKAVFLGDLAPFAIHIERLAWVPAFDLDPMTTIDTKRKTIADALDNDHILIFEHDPKIAVGRLRPHGSRWRVEPLGDSL